jgi:hypothetical protein
VCSVAPEREAAVKDKGNASAEWGTAAHAMSEHCLKNNIAAGDAPVTEKWAAYDGPEMRECVQEYLDFVRAKLINGGHLFVEQALQIFPLQGVWGTADAVIVGHEVGLLDVCDLKGGIGVLVDADDNSQLKLYAWGAYQSLEWLSETPLDRIRVSIIQPRRGNTVSKTFTADELRAWVAEVRPKVEAAFAGGGKAVPGDHCRWCRVRATCEERREFIQASAAMVFADGCKPDVASMNEAVIVQVFKHIPVIEQYLKDIETWVADQSHERGHALLGLKWVAGRATRVIKDEDGAAKALALLNLNGYAPAKLLGVTEITKQLKGLGLKFDEVLKPFVETRVSPPVLVAEEDKRAEYDPDAGAKSAFAA